ncbi:PREDICTED: phosphate transporter PHO1 [Ipomoea nil]|uniref:phosphate transporter PHO1 n=1 Tax=Ipomoea nil TaxID=35883 RepID=UPI000901813E|nr:PREDICTED: phosphate transporter PHO1 [Ipomoea nil]
MVKFSKELEAQLIPEWKDAFVNYWQLKKQVKKIKLSRRTKPVHDGNDFGLPIFDRVRGFVKTIADKLHDSAAGKSETNAQVNSQIKGDDNNGEEEEEEMYETENELVQLFSEEDEVNVFFENLDEELKKVNEFYKAKESEFLERGEILSKQLQILLDLKQVLHDRRRKTLGRSRSASGFFSRSNSSSRRNSDYCSDNRSECCGSPTGNSETSQTADDEVMAALERNGINFVNAASREAKTAKNGKPKVAIRIDIPATTPTRAISAVTSMVWEDFLNNGGDSVKEGGREYVNSKKIQCAEKMIRGAYVELYRGLGLLKTYSSLNMVAFVKILKKFDKVSNRQASANYLKQVKRSHFISSDKVVRLMDEVESLFTQHFATNDRKKAMKFLRPQQQKESHMITFFAGLFTGCFVSLFVVYGILAHLSGMFSPGTDAGYVETVYPVFSMFALLSLHVFLYGCNLFLWKSTRINYNFIFEFQPKTALKYRDAFLICTSLMTAVVGAMVVHLILLSKGFTSNQVHDIPGVLILCFLVLLICPLNILYRPTRVCFLRVIRNIVCSPFYKVLMVDFFMADQLTSQIPLLRHMESTACYFLAGSFKTHRFETCKSGQMYRELAYVISFAPYYWRAAQCARRWFDENDVNHLANFGKYLSAMVAAGARLTYSREPDSKLWLAMVLVTSTIATVYQLYWDFVKDWGFFNLKCKNPLLRDELVLKNKIIYYVSIVLNFVLRLAWVETVMRFNVGIFESRLLDFSLASLEVFRRGHWNFYRLEHEHLSNVGKFRAVKAVPLPFRETDSDG